MTKLLITATALLLSITAFAQQPEVLLDAKIINYGALSQDTNLPANELIVVKRTAATPKKVELRFIFNRMEKSCISYKVKKVEIKDFTKTVCDKNADGSHQCAEVQYTGLYDAETVCSKDGLIRVRTAKKLTLNFSSAVKLVEGAEETFQINLKQRKMSYDKVEKAAQTLNTASLYKITTLFNSIKFKAK
jgi:hypothetical protein